jgi:hypothetical protein
MNFIGLDIHKKTISYCVKDAAGEVLAEGMIPATRGKHGPKLQDIPGQVLYGTEECPRLSRRPEAAQTRLLH